MESQEFEKESVMSENEELKILGIEKFDRAEWVFQFDEDEPVVIAWSNSKDDPGDLSFMLKADSGSNIIFKSNDGRRTFKIFARRMPDERRAELDEIQKKEEELLNKINGSTEE